MHVAHRDFPKSAPTKWMCGPMQVALADPDCGGSAAIANLSASFRLASSRSALRTSTRA